MLEQKIHIQSSNGSETRGTPIPLHTQVQSKQPIFRGYIKYILQEQQSYKISLERNLSNSTTTESQLHRVIYC